MTVDLHCVERPGWEHVTTADAELWWAGDRATAERLAHCLAADDPAAALDAVLVDCRAFFAVVARRGDAGLAAVDHCRSTPVFHAELGSRLQLGNAAEPLLGRQPRQHVDPASHLESAMAGFVTAGHTLYDGLRQLRPGEAVIAPGGAQPVRFKRWYVYRPTTDNGRREPRPGDVGRALDDAVTRTVERAGGAPILVPLSGGLDSRALLGKLVEHGCRNLRAFSYGAPGNTDAAAARRVANTLEVPWRFVPITGRAARRFLASEERRRYWAFADGLGSVPNNQDILPLTMLRNADELAPGTVVVNGQTGDFISGGHIPAALLAGTPTVGQVIDEIVAKHYALWSPLLTDANHRVVAARIRDVLDLRLDDDAEIQPAAAAALAEQWEYEGRQASYIVNGQRAYEYLGLGWDLPFWHRPFVDFWRDVPVALKVGQALYRRYLEDWNFRGLFSGMRDNVTAWGPLSSSLIVPLAVGCRIVVGRERRDRLFRLTRYFDRFGHHYRAFGFREFARDSGNLRNAASLYVRTWLVERGLGMPEGA